MGFWDFSKSTDGDLETLWCVNMHVHIRGYLLVATRKIAIVVCITKDGWPPVTSC